MSVIVSQGPKEFVFASLEILNRCRRLRVVVKGYLSRVVYTRPFAGVTRLRNRCRNRSSICTDVRFYGHLRCISVVVKRSQNFARTNLVFYNTVIKFNNPFQLSRSIFAEIILSGGIVRNRICKFVGVCRETAVCG